MRLEYIIYNNTTYLSFMICPPPKKNKDFVKTQNLAIYCIVIVAISVTAAIAKSGK